MKKSINGVGIMSEKITSYCGELVKIIKTIPDIEVEQKDGCYNMKIKNHSPLDEVNFQYVCENRIWSKDYILHFKICQTGRQHYTKRKIILHKTIWLNKSAKDDLVAKKLNENKLLSDLIMQFCDLGGNVEIDLDGQKVMIRNNMIPGTIVNLILPPITKFIVPSEKEIIMLLQISQIILKELE